MNSASIFVCHNTNEEEQQQQGNNDDDSFLNNISDDDEMEEHGDDDDDGIECEYESDYEYVDEDDDDHGVPKIKSHSPTESLADICDTLSTRSPIMMCDCATTTAMNNEDHSPVTDCRMMKEWNQLVQDLGNGIIDIDSSLIEEYAMKRRVELCHDFLHRSIRVTGGWALTATTNDNNDDSNNNNNNHDNNNLQRLPVEIQTLLLTRADRFFDHATLDVVASQLRFYRWNVDEWREAHRRRAELERTWYGERLPGRRRAETLQRLEQQMMRWGLDQERDEEEGEGSSDADVQRDHEAFLAGTIQGEQAQPAAQRVAQPSQTEQEERTTMMDTEILEMTPSVAWACSICFDDEVEEQDRISICRGAQDYCGHLFCRGCWTQFIEGWLQDARAGGGSLATRLDCPHPRCLAQVTRQHVERVVGGESPLLELHDELALNSFVEGHRDTICWCPGPECRQIMIRCGEGYLVPCAGRIPGQTTRGFFTRCNTCDTRFCFECGNSLQEHEGIRRCPRPHNLEAVVHPFDLDVQELNRGQARVAARQQEALNESSTDNKIRPCPRCTVPIEKNGGCNHMRCKCGHHFCWLCLADMTGPNMAHYCGRESGGDMYALRRLQERNQQQRSQLLSLPRMDLEFVRTIIQQERNREGGDASDDTIRRREKLIRFAHYFNRYMAHSQGQTFAENQCECLMGRAQEFTLVSNLRSGVDTDFFGVANQKLIACRRQLKYSYVFMYFNLSDVATAEGAEIQEGGGCPSDNAMSASLPIPLALFLDHQERLERITEQLSFLSEGAVTRTDRQRVLDMINTVDHCLQAVTASSLEQERHGSPRTG